MNRGFRGPQLLEQLLRTDLAGRVQRRTVDQLIDLCQRTMLMNPMLGMGVRARMSVRMIV